MVWPPSKVHAPPEGEASAETPGVALPQPLPQAPHSSSPDWLERPEALIGSVLGDRYRVTAVLGRGPMGIAFEGESSRGRQVTLKLLPRSPELPAEHFAWQVRQTLALAHFDHPSVTPLTDFGPLGNSGAFVSRNRMPGVTLRSLLGQGGLPLRRSLLIARQIASALSAAHAQDIAHGRLKPENILIQGGTGPGDVVKVVDFGMSGLSVDLRAVAPGENEARRLELRTRLYLPPGAAPSGAGTDVYSLGVMLFEMISGQPPFLSEPGSGDPGRARLSFAQCSPPLQVPRAVDDLVQSMMHPDAARQGLDAGRLVQLFDELLGRPSVAPSSPSASAARAPAADSRGGAAPAEGRASFWPHAAPAEAAGRVSFPPLPEGYAPSPLPPAPVSQAAPRSSAYPPGPPPPGGARAPVAPSGPPSAPPASSVSDEDEDEANFRPSLIARLRRLFGRSRNDSGF